MPRKFSDLRPAAPAPEKPDDDSIEKVMQRLSLTRDGMLMLTWMREEIAGPSVLGAADYMLREAEGKRRVLHQLIGFTTPN